jgi:glycosyltransferase involved in cell wall biosynthesis
MTTSPPLAIAVSTLGRFHLFDAARAVKAAGHHVSLYTTVPRLLVDTDLRAIAHARPWLFGLGQVRARAGAVSRTTWLEDMTLADCGRWLARRMKGCDVLHALAGTGLEAGRRLHEEGGRWVCDRASTHIRTQQAILEEEHARWGVEAPYFSAAGTERAEAEYDGADAIVVPSEFVRRSFLERGFSEARIVKCTYGVDLTHFQPRPRHESRRTLRVVFLGTASVRKGIGYLLEAVRPLVREGAVETWLIGARHPQAAPVLARHAGEFQAFGPFPRRELSAWLSRCDVLVLPSVEEGLAYVMAQAMACGIPVVATPNTGAEDLFTDGVEGFIVPPRSSESIRERLRWMLDHRDDVREMGRAALARVQRVGGWSAYAEGLVDLYRSLVGAPAAARG